MLYYSYLTCAYGGRARHRQQSGSADVAPCIVYLFGLLTNSRVLPTHHVECVYMCSVFVLIALFFGGGGVLKCFQGSRSFS